MADTVIHDPDGSRFVLMRGAQEIGQEVYETRPDGGIVFVHTEVDPNLQEKGLGTALVQGALDQVRTLTEARIGATCPFVKRYLEEHPEYNDLTSR